MNITLIADGHPREWPILRELEEAFPGTLWIQPRYDQPDPTANTEAPSVLRKLSGFYYRVRDGLRRRMMQRIVGGGAPHFKNKVELPWFDLENERGLQLVKESQPDVIVTCRAPILSPELLNIARRCGVNVHFGIVPNYRGNEGLFWAAFQNDYKSFGGSIHLLNSGVDTGGRLVDAYPNLTGKEMLVEIEVEVSRALAGALTRCLQKIDKLKGAPDGKPQGCIGRNYRSSERNWKKDLSCFFKRRRHRVPEQRARQDFYF